MIMTKYLAKAAWEGHIHYTSVIRVYYNGEDLAAESGAAGHTAAEAGASGHVAAAVGKQREMIADAQLAFLSHSVLDPSHGWCCSHSG